MLAPRTPILDAIERARSRAILRRNAAFADRQPERGAAFAIAQVRLEAAWERVADVACFRCHRGGHHFQRCPR